MNRVTDERHTKIQPQHLERGAYVHVLQSSPRQVIEHRESQRRQYVIALEATRLSRNGPDWHHLLYLCRLPTGGFWGYAGRCVSWKSRPPSNAW